MNLPFDKIKFVYILFVFSYVMLDCYAQHNPGSNCMQCHDQFKIAGTVFTDSLGTQSYSDVSMSLFRSDGTEIRFDNTDRNGNFAYPEIAGGNYLIQIYNIRSRTWHQLPEQGSCNTCHIQGGNSSEIRTKKFNVGHTQIPEDNNCKHCHHFPATMHYDQLMAPTVLNVNSERLAIPGSRVILLGQNYTFKPEDYEITTVRPDIFAEGFYSMLDVILAVADKNGLNIIYHYDESRKTHFIDSVNGVEGDYWYGFSYDAGQSLRQEEEISSRRANRWDELLFRTGAWVSLVEGGNLDEIKQAYFNEIKRKKKFGNVIPRVDLMINPSNYNGNPEGSGRITYRETFWDVLVTAHNLRAVGYPSPHSKPFQPGVVTSIDILYSLMDQGVLNVVTPVFYTYFANNFIDSYYVVEIGIEGIGVAHSSGRHGFVYVTENGSFNQLPNRASRTLHITSDIHVIHAPDFSFWRWIELGRPYYERTLPTNVEEKLVIEDYNSLDRDFNLHPPYPNPFNSWVTISYNIFIPGAVAIKVYDITGKLIDTIKDEYDQNIGVKHITWSPENLASGVYYLTMNFNKNQQVRTISYVK